MRIGYDCITVIYNLSSLKKMETTFFPSSKLVLFLNRIYTLKFKPQTAMFWLFTYCRKAVKGLSLDIDFWTNT